MMPFMNCSNTDHTLRAFRRRVSASGIISGHPELFVATPLDVSAEFEARGLRLDQQGIPCQIGSCPEDPDRIFGVPPYAGIGNRKLLGVAKMLINPCGRNVNFDMALTCYASKPVRSSPS